MNEGHGGRAQALLDQIVKRSIEAVKPSTLFDNYFRVSDGILECFGARVDLRDFSGIKCVALGKSAESMAFEVRKVLGEKVSGLIATPTEKRMAVEGFKFFKTGHPLPDKQSVMAGVAAAGIVADSGDNDLIIFLVSGGGSASVFVPRDGITLEESNRLSELMLHGGLPISDVNLVRRQISKFGGGKLAHLAPGARKISLVISDVVGDELSTIASGPTVADVSTEHDAAMLLERCGLSPKTPASILNELRKGAVNWRNPDLPNSSAIVIASNKISLAAAERTGIDNGFDSKIITRFYEGDVKEAAGMLLSIARSIERDGEPMTPPALVLFGGETTVAVKGVGIGGRNQELVLNALAGLDALHRRGEDLGRSTFFSFGTDGKDGNSDSAGASASFQTMMRVMGGRDEMDDYLRRNDSSSFFLKYGEPIKTGPTDTNVMDIFGVIVE